MDINVKVTLDTSERFVKTAAMIVALVAGGAHLAVARVKNPTDEEDENRRRFEEVRRKAEAYAHAAQEAPQDAPKDEPEQSPAEEKRDDPEPKNEPAPEAPSEEQHQDPEPEPEKKEDPAPVVHHTTADLRSLCNEKCKALGADDNKMIVKVRDFLKNLLKDRGIKSFNEEIAPDLCDELYDQINALELSMIA